METPARSRPRRIIGLLLTMALAALGTPLSSAPTPAPIPAPIPVPAPTPVPAASQASLAIAPVVRVLRDDRVATIEMDYNADNPQYQFWNMTGSPDDDAGFLVVWWPQTPPAASKASRLLTNMDSQGMCLSYDSPLARAIEERKVASSVAAKVATGLSLPAGAKWLVTANRRVQVQPLDNGVPYQVRVQRLSARGKITSKATQVVFNGGDPARVNALRASMTHFDDFNLPLGAADEKNWNSAQTVPTEERFNLFFVNDQYHAHSLQGTVRESLNPGVGDKSQLSQRFRKKIRIEPNVRRRIVFDMDTPRSNRSVWYLDLNPVPVDLTGHSSFFDQEGDLGLPAGVVRLKAAGDALSVNIIDAWGASHTVASVDMAALGREAVSNVRRSFDVQVGNNGIRVDIDGKKIIDATFAPYTLPSADNELLWVNIGYNTTKDNVYYYLHHWDNFGFDGPVVDAREAHNYVTRIQGTDLQKVTGQSPRTFTVKIPDDLRPKISGAVAEAWLIYTLQPADYSALTIAPGDFIEFNGGTRHTMPPKSNNSLTPSLSNDWAQPFTQRVKLGDLVMGGNSPMTVGDNTFKFNVQSAGVLNVHVEVLYPPGSAPTYTPPSAIHHFPTHAELPRMGPPVRLQRIGNTDIGYDQTMSSTSPVRIPVSGVVPINVEAGNSSWAGWAPEWMRVPVNSAEVFTTGGTAGIAKIEVFLRRVGTGTGPGNLVLSLDTAIDAPAPQGRYRLSFDSRPFANGDYELFVQATTPSGLKRHPSYGDETHHFDFSVVYGAYYPMPIRIQN